MQVFSEIKVWVPRNKVGPRVFDDLRGVKSETVFRFDQSVKDSPRYDESSLDGGF